MAAFTVLVDMDGVLDNLTETWVGFLNRRYGTSVRFEDVKTWDMSAAFPALTKEELYAPLREAALWREVRPPPYAFESLRRLADSYRVFIVTASHPDTVAVKLNTFLFPNYPFLSWKDVIVASRKQMILGDVLIDDAPHNLIGGAARGILMTAPYNRDFNAEAHGILRAENWKEVEALVSEMARNGRKHTPA